DVAYFFRGVLDDFEQVGQDGHPVVAVVQDLQCPVEDGLLAVGGRGGAHDRQQGGDHGQPAPVGIGDDLGAGLAGEAVGGGLGFAGVEHVEVAQPAAQAD